MRPPRKPSSERAQRLLRTLLCCCLVLVAAIATVVLLLPTLRQLSAAPTVTSGDSGTPLSRTAHITEQAQGQQEPKPSPVPSPVPSPTRPRIDLAKVAKALDPEIMENALPVDHLLPLSDPSASPDSQISASVLKGFRNPCWKIGELTRCLPYVYLAGSFQAGQDTLYEKLVAHPDIVHNEMTRWQFWGEEGKLMSQYVDKHGKSLPELSQDPAKKIIIDGSASTFAFYWSAGLRTHQAFQKAVKPCWANCSEGSRGKKEALHKCMEERCYPASMAADKKVASDLGVPYDELHLPVLMAAAYGGHKTTAHLPKMIVLLRNPIERLHSAFWHYAHYKNKYGETAEGFLAYVKEQVGALRDCEARGFTARECAFYFEALGVKEEQLFFHADQFMRGMYSLYLEVWLRHLPRSNVLVLKAEEYFVDPMASLNQVYAFLGLEHPADEKAARRIENAGRRGSSTSANGRPAMLPEAAQILKDLYRPWNQQLSDILGDPSYAAWG